MSLFKRIVLIIILAGLLSMSATTFASPARQDSGAQVVTHDQTGLTSFIGIDTNAAAGLSRASSSAPDIASALADIGLYAADFGLQNPAQELQFLKVSSQSGSLSFRYQQVYQGVPILGGELIANYDASGQLAALSGEISPRPSLSTTPTIAAASAASIAIDAVARRENVAASELTASEPSLWIYDPRLISPDTFMTRLVWRTEVRPSQSLLPIRYLVLIDAHLSGVALAFNQIHHIGGPRDVALRTDSQPASNIIASSPASVSPAPNFPNPVIRTYNANLKPVLPGALVCSNIPSALMGAGSCQGGSSGATEPNAAHLFAYQTFNYFDVKHGRNSINNAGLNLISTVNFRSNPSQPFYNAFWTGSQMVYGDADYFTADDVVGHELTHGVTQYESGLFYWYESGAINEAMSDIFGEIFDQWNGIDRFGNPDEIGDKWIVGEDLFDPIRSMSHPPDYDQPDRTQSPLYHTNVSDGGGVHFNSGVANKAAYLMAEGGTFNGQTVTALGNDKTAAIFYLVNSTLLTSGADFETLGAATVQACNNIRIGNNPLGITAADCNETHEAVLATEMHLDPVAAVDFTPEASLCPAGTAASNYLFNDNIENGLGNFVDGTLVNSSGMPSGSAWQESSTIGGLGSYATSGTKSLFGVNHPWLYGYGDGIYLSFIRMANNVTLPLGSTYYLHFNHSVALEAGGNFDGGVLEYSINNGAFVDAQSLFSAGQDYMGTVSSSYGNPLGGRQAFTQTSHGYVSSRYNLGSLAGSNIRFRWVIGADQSFPWYSDLYGWWLDDIKVYECVVPSPEIAVLGPNGDDIPDGGSFNVGTTSLGIPINRTITVRNIGLLDLTISTNPPNTTGSFSASSFTATTLEPDSSATFVISCDAITLGSATGTISFSNSDSNEDPFNFDLSCAVNETPLSATPVRNYFNTSTPTLNWNPLTWGVDFYELQVAANSAFASANSFYVYGLSHTLPTPLPNGTYYWRVRGRNNTRLGAWSATETMVIAAP